MQGSRPRHKVMAFAGARANLRSVFVGALVLVIGGGLFLMYWGHMSAHANEKSLLMERIGNLEASLSMHHTTEHKTLNQEVEEKEHEVESLKGQVAVAALKTAEGDGLLQKSLGEIDTTVGRLQDRIRTLESGMTQHETHHRENLDPNTHSHAGNELAVGSTAEALVEQMNKKVRELEAEVHSHKEYHRLNVDPHMHSHTPGQLRGSSSSIASSDSVNIGGSDVTTTGAKAGAALVPAVGGDALGKDTVLLVMASHRDTYLKRCLSKVVQYHPRGGNVPIVVSEDGNNMQMRDVVNGARDSLKTVDSTASLLHMNHRASPADRGANGYFALSAHFKWALTQVFERYADIGLSSAPARVIILEEDLEIAADFYAYFAAVAPLVDTDKTLLAASAWNDNGQERNVRDPSQIYRSDFFPGLGWLMPSRVWVELAPKWPKAYWDDWLREPKNRLGRHILRPEVCRTLHYGIKGVSNAQYQSNWMTDTRLNARPVDFTKLDLSYLRADKWDAYYIEGHVKTAQLSTPDMLDQKRIRDKVSNSPDGDGGGSVVPVHEYRVEYEGNAGFEQVARWAKAMDNIKANVPRTAYKGVVTIWFGDAKLHLVPKGLLP